MSGVGISGIIANLPGTVTPYPTQDPSLELGGFRQVANLAARDAILPQFRTIGMVCTLQTDGSSYQLVGGTDNTHWTAFSTGAQGNQGAQGSSGGPQGLQGSQGVQGSQGQRGTQGFQGLTGTGNQGLQGSQGPSGGAQGGQGTQGFQGSQGNQGATGTGLQGSQGGPGVQGSQGSSGGAQGNQGGLGLQGFQGVPGTQGNQGSQGVGTQGAQGSQGQTGGAQGSQGATGPQGNQGFQGLTGTGLQGSQGTTGTQGSQGPSGGAQGTQGSQGAQGSQGNTGVQGSTGLGFQGFQGTAGATGSQGSAGGAQGFQGGAGAQGTAGAGGAQGSQGNQGSQGGLGGTGNQGAQGFQGLTGTGLQGSQGGTGTQGSQGPSGGAQGNQGATGTTGLQGSQGSQGGLGAQGIQGTSGTNGTQGGQGSQGAQGVTGTGLQGSQGTTGTQGSQGPSGGAQGGQGGQGAQGSQGNQGQAGAGFQGAQGSQGGLGLQGTTGTAGSQGATGSGLQGAQGSTGATGLQGFAGAGGVQGNQGARGAQGFQGATGTQGAQGFQGGIGAQGGQGFQGVTGTQGSQGFQGLTGTGLQGAQGNTGLQGNTGGAQGAQGSQGFQGAGAQGAQGATGTGLQGSTGAQGTGGTTGAQGSQGPSGGAQGNQGATGLQGSQGAFGGAQGFQGATGTQGSQGFQGTQGAGFQGSQGGTGTQGSQGPSGGAQGFQGATGSLGLQGSQGFQGARGVTGLQGSQGNTGATGLGLQGFTGAQGFQGQGAQGNQGAQGTAGSQGSQGAGLQGAQGGTGTQGSQGFQGTQGAGTQGSQGSTGTQGSQGPSGGAQGTQGATGTQGSQGFQGTQGAGFQGAQGGTGTQGSQGPSGGAQGNQGATGTQGFQGFQGLTGTGAQGNQGTTGTQGSQGPSGGAQGFQGATGTQGFQGFQGFQGLVGTGNQGSQGATGLQGNTGGAQGSQGAAGGAGTQGNQGFQGAQGSQGAGFQGFQGATGLQGNTGGAQGFQGGAGLQGAAGAQGSQGAGTQGSQGAQGTQGAGSASRVFSNTFFVDQTYSGTSTGALEAPFSTILAAVTAAPTGTPTMLLLAPGSYTEAAITIPGGKVLAIQLIEFSGLPNATITHALTWTVNNDDELHISGVDVPAGITAVDGTGGGQCVLRLENLAVGAISANIAHTVTMVTTAQSSNANSENASIGCTMNGVVSVSGQIRSQNTYFRAATTSPSAIFFDTCTLDGAVTYTAPFVTCVNVIVASGTVTIAASTSLIADDYSAYSFEGHMTLTGGGTMVLAAATSLSETVLGNVTGAVGLNFQTSTAYAFTMTGNISLTFTAPLYSKLLEIRFAQDATGSRQVSWPGNVQNTPTPYTSGQTAVFLYYSKPANTYYPLALGQSGQVSTFNSSPPKYLVSSLSGSQGVGVFGTGIPPNDSAQIQVTSDIPNFSTVTGNTVTDALNTLKASGSQGSQGTRGFQGFQGLQGAQGSQGGLGSQGSQGSGSQGAQGSQGGLGLQGNQGTQGSGSQGSQGSQGVIGAQGASGAGASSRVFSNTIFVDQTFGGTSTGALESPYKTIQAALTAAPTATPTMIIVAPGTYAETPSLLSGKVIALQLFEYSAGAKASITGLFTWNIAVNDVLSISGIDLPSGISQVDAGTTNGPASLNIENSVIDGISGTTSFAVVGCTVNAQQKGGSTLLGTTTIFGTLQTQNTVLNGTITANQSIAVINGQLVGGTYQTQALTLEDTDFTGGAITLDSVANLYIDDYTGWQARNKFIFLGQALVTLISSASLQLVTAGVGGSTITINFNANSSNQFLLDQNVTMTFVDPIYPQLVQLLLIQGGIEQWTVTWPSSVHNPPPVNLFGLTSVLMYWSGSNYYPVLLGQPGSGAQGSQGFQGARGAQGFQGSGAQGAAGAQGSQGVQGSSLTVLTTAALATLPAGTFADGTAANVAGFDSFALNLLPGSATADGVNLITASGTGGGLWARQYASLATNQSLSVIYVDGTSAGNDGARNPSNPGTPLQTLQEAFNRIRRLTLATLPSDIQIHYSSRTEESFDADLTGCEISTGTCNITISGTPTLVTTQTIVGISNANPATNQLGLIAYGSGSIAAGEPLRIGTKVGWVYNNAGGGSSNVTVFFDQDGTAYYPQVGDSFSHIQYLDPIGNITARIPSGFHLQVVSCVVNGEVLAEGTHSNPASPLSGASPLGGILFNQCKMLSGQNYGTITYINCHKHGVLGTAAPGPIGTQYFGNCIFDTSVILTNATAIFAGSTTTYIGRLVLQNSRVSCVDMSGLADWLFFGLSSTASAIVVDTSNLRLGVATVWGNISGGVNQAFEVGAGGWVYYTSTSLPTISGATSAWKIGGAGGGGRLGSFAQLPAISPMVPAGFVLLDSTAGEEGANVYSTLVTSNIPAQNFFSTTPKAGLYRVSAYAALIHIGTSGTLSLNATFTDDSGFSHTVTICTISSIGTSTNGVGDSIIAELNGSTALQWSVTGITTPGPLQASIRLVVEKLSSGS